MKSIIICALIMFSFGISTAFGQSSEMDALCEQGNNAYNEKDYSLAVLCYRKAAKQNHAISQNNLALCYEYGLGVKRNFAQAALWYEKAIRNGCTDAGKNMKRLFNDRQKEIDDAEVERRKIVREAKRILNELDGKIQNYKAEDVAIVIQGSQNVLDKLEKQTKADNEDIALMNTIKGRNTLTLDTPEGSINTTNVRTASRRVRGSRQRNTDNQTGKKVRREELIGGGYCEITDYPDGSRRMKTVRKCVICHGTKQCKVCFGAKGVFTNMWYPCNSCMETGVCRFCKGTGYTEMYTVFENGVAIGYDNNGGFAIGTSQMDVSIPDTPQNIDKTSTKSGLKQETCGLCHGTGKNPGCDYGPQYTSDPSAKTYRYCPICKKDGEAHTHGVCPSCQGKGYNLRRAY
ncbi:hypothetical protein AAE250_02630 [Bacteroides sp. GD17]|uniref:hypothetical protein n=1 Tax=Bacteroides sp. GD17 TaxID=3139826 RepID=UPI0025DABBF8|nr:hypothetical protein [uncultured Bacteroides sp.]